MKTPPLALYAHFPWCVQKCPYCDFNSYTLRDELPEQRYIETLLRDLDAQLPRVAGRPLTSIFLGRRYAQPVFARGHRTLSRARAHALGFAGDIEVTLEANPGTIERGRFAEYRAAGVTRVSLGAQSFDARQLKLLGRIHSADETRRAAEELHAAGLTNFNLDLMYALPGQTARKPSGSRRRSRSIPRICRSTTSPSSPARCSRQRRRSQPADDVVEEMLDRSLRTLEDAGSSNTRCRAMRAPARDASTTSTTGPSATTSASAPARTASFRFPPAASGAHAADSRAAALSRRGSGALVRKQIAVAELPFEFAMNGFRLVDGFDDDLFEARTGLPIAMLERGAGAAGGPRTGGTGREALARDPQRLPISQRHTRRTAAADAESTAARDASPPCLGGFMHRCPITGT